MQEHFKQPIESWGGQCGFGKFFNNKLTQRRSKI